MIVLYVLLGILALLLLLLLTPVHLQARYDGALRVRARYLFLVFPLYPRPEKRKKTVKRAKRKRREASKAEPEKKKKKELSQWERLLREEGPSGLVRTVADLARLAGTAAGRILAAVTVDRLTLCLIVASEDAADTAVNYGKACAALYPSLAVLESAVRVRRRDIALAPDFLRRRGEVRGEIRLHVRPLRILWALLRLVGAYMGNTFKQQWNEQKALEGKQTERG